MAFVPVFIFANVQIIMASSKYPLTFFYGNHNPAGILLIYNVVVLILGDVIKNTLMFRISNKTDGSFVFITYN